jgi:hypothetical protein
MKNINLLIDYLNPRKYDSDNTFRNSYLIFKIDENYINEDFNYHSEKVNSFVFDQLALDFHRTFASFDVPEPVDTEKLYVDLSSNNIGYYFQEEIDGIIKYISIENALKRNILDSYYEVLDDQYFIHVPLETRVYYHRENRGVYSAIEVAPQLIIKPVPTLYYNPNRLGTLKSGQHTLEYTDSTGGEFSYVDYVTSQLPILSSFVDDPLKRLIELSLNPKIGKVHWYPRLIIDDLKVSICYDYYPYQPSLEGGIGNEGFDKYTPAIKIDFNHYEGFLAFMMLIYFRNGISVLETSVGFQNRKQEAFEAYINFLRHLFSLDTTLEEKMKALYYIPADVFIKQQRRYETSEGSGILGLDFLWGILDTAIKPAVNKPELNDFGTQSELIVIQILKALQQIYIDQKKDRQEGNFEFLNKLLYHSPNLFEGYLRTLFNIMQGSEFKMLNSFIYKIWEDSPYKNPLHPEFRETSQFADNKRNVLDEDYPIAILPYKTDKTIGFYSSNMNLRFIHEDFIEVTPDEHFIDNLYEIFDPEGGRALSRLIEDNWVNIYHPYQPVYLSNLNSKTAISLHRISPIFLLKSNEDKSFWENLATAGEYALDIITTLSGVGNLAKFRYLGKAIKAAKAAGKSRTVILTYKASRVVEGFNGLVEITSGTVNILLKLTGANDTPFGKALSSILMWMEIGGLSLDIVKTPIVRLGIKKNAKTLIDSEAIKLETKLDELVDSNQISRSQKLDFKLEEVS